VIIQCIGGMLKTDDMGHLS